MLVTPQTLIAVLSAALPLAAAWDLTAYASTPSCNAKDDTQYRVLRGEGSSGCLTFGKDMPGTSCTKFTNGGGNSGPCDGEAFHVFSVLAQSGTTCTLYNLPDCQSQGAMVYSRPGKDSGPKCQSSLGVIQSFTCGSEAPADLPDGFGGF